MVDTDSVPEGDGVPDDERDIVAEVVGVGPEAEPVADFVPKVSEVVNDKEPDGEMDVVAVNVHGVLETVDGRDADCVIEAVTSAEREELRVSLAEPSVTEEECVMERVACKEAVAEIEVVNDAEPDAEPDRVTDWVGGFDALGPGVIVTDRVKVTDGVSPGVILFVRLAEMESVEDGVEAGERVVETDADNVNEPDGENDSVGLPKVGLAVPDVVGEPADTDAVWVSDVLWVGTGLALGEKTVVEGVSVWDRLPSESEADAVEVDVSDLERLLVGDIDIELDLVDDSLVVNDFDKESLSVISALTVNSLVSVKSCGDAVKVSGLSDTELVAETEVEGESVVETD